MERHGSDNHDEPLARVEHERHETIVFATVHGEIDLSNAASVEEEILREAGTRGLAVDLSEVSYLDSSGLAMLSRLAERLGAEGRWFSVVVSPGAPTRRLFEVVGLESIVLVADRDAVLARIAGGES